MATRAFQSNPLSIALTAVLALPRPLLSHLVACAIERLDQIDGDCDLELGGDDDTGNAEDEIYAGNPYFLPRGAGCRLCDEDVGLDGS